MKRILLWLSEVCWLAANPTEESGSAMRPVETVSEERLSEMFKHAPGSPSWKATLAVLNQVTVEHMEECVDERLSNDQLRFRLGGVAALLEFNRELEQREREASRAPKKEEESGQ